MLGAWLLFGLGYVLLCALLVWYFSRIDRPRPRRRLTGRQTLLVWAGLLVIAWLDRGPHVHAHQAAAFSFVIAAVSFIVDVIKTVGVVIADSLVAVVGYLVTTVIWILTTLGNVILSTGSIFAKVWDGLKIVWNDAIKPALLWVDRTVGRIAGWLKKTMAPIFTFLRHVKDELTLVWKRFVRPVLDVIDFVHQLDRLLQVFHIDILKGLDNTLQAIEQRIDGVFQWIYGKLNDITNTLTLIVTADGFFQRYTFVRTLARDVALHWRILTNSRSKPLREADMLKLGRAKATQSPPDLVQSIDAYWGGAKNDVGDAIDAAVSRSIDTWDSFGQTNA